MLRNGIDDPESFAYPFGSFNGADKKVVSQCGFTNARQGGGISSSNTTPGPPWAETLPPKHPEAVRTIAVDAARPIRLRDLERYVAGTAAHSGGWLPITFHDVCDANASDFIHCMSTYGAIQDTVLGQFLDWLRNNGHSGGAPAGIVVRTMRWAINTAKGPDTTAPTTTVLCNNSSCRPSYNGPVTVRLSAADPSGVGVAKTYFTTNGSAPNTSSRVYQVPLVLRNARAVAIVTAAICGVATVALALLPQVQLDYAWPQVPLALETSGSLIALVAGFLVFGRLLRRTYLDELLLASALAVLALSNLLFVTVPTMAGWAPDDLTVWAAPIARSLGALLFALAAFVPHHGMRRSGEVLPLTAAAVITAVALAAIFVHAFSQRWPPKYAATVTPQAVAQPALYVHPALFAFELMVALLYGLAANWFLRRSRRFRDEFFGWLAVAAVLAVASHVNYSLFPSLYSQSMLYTGDIFRFAFYVALLFGCMREIWSYWSVLSETAVLEERRRIARDLHDGL